MIDSCFRFYPLYLFKLANGQFSRKKRLNQFCSRCFPSKGVSLTRNTFSGEFSLIKYPAFQVRGLRQPAARDRVVQERQEVPPLALRVRRQHVRGVRQRRGEQGRHDAGRELVVRGEERGVRLQCVQRPRIRLPRVEGHAPQRALKFNS